MPENFIENAIRIYYSNPTLGNMEIRELFGIKALDAVKRKKKTALELMEKNNIPVWFTGRVDTETAYKAWGLDIKKLERSYAKLKEFGMLEVIV